MYFLVPLSSDLPQIEMLLQQSGLPYTDCHNHLKNFVIAKEDDEIIGIGGLELYGEVSLIRSLVVSEKYKGQGIGHTIYTKIKDKAIMLGVKEFYLLTHTAAAYFKARNFYIIKRDSAPQSIQQTNQFSKLCPSSALVMKCIL